MINALFSVYWMIGTGYHSAVEKIIATVLASAAAETNAMPEAGSADDAERSGLPIKKMGSVAIVKTAGPMVKNAGWMSRYGMAGTRETQQSLIAAANDGEVESIIWVMDTPGGSVDGLEELARIVNDIKNEKPIIVQVDGLLASAGYYVASQASEIYASPGSLVGSIGTRIALYDYSEMFLQAGVKAIAVDTGEHKSAGMQGTEITDAQVAEFQRIVDGYNQMFLSAVQSGRDMSKKDVDTVADGRVFFAEQSIELGLIDGVQTLSETLSQYTQQTRSSTKRAARAARMKLINGA